MRSASRKLRPASATAGSVRSELVGDCLKRIDEVDRDIEAWAFLDRDHAMRQAEAADDHRKQGKATGPLHGVPVGIKDIFDTGDMPTEFGSKLWAGRTPRRDAAAVARLRAAGAVILGKTVTTEYAYFNPGKTRNPHNPDHTPGGSSSGLGRGRGGADGAGRHRLADQRLGDPPRRLLRRGRLQADARADPAQRRAAAVAGARSCRRVRALGRRCGAAGRDAGGLRRGGSGYAAARPSAASSMWRQASRHCRRASPSSARRPGSMPRR